MVAKRIPVYVPQPPANAEKYVNHAIRENWIGSSVKDPSVDYLSRLENKFADFCGRSYASAVSSGTTALRLTWEILGIGDGDEVVVPDLTMIAVASTLTQAGGTPVFADVDEFNYCIDPAQIKNLITPRTRAIVAAHSYGQPPDLCALRRVAEDHGIWLVEDAAQGLGAVCAGRPAGGWGHIACFSLYANKLVTAGEGGMLVMDDAALYEQAELKKNHVFQSRRFEHDEIGFNFRLGNLAAAYACASFEELPQNCHVRKKITAAYQTRLAETPGLSFQQRIPDTETNSWMTTLRVGPEYPISRDELAERLDLEYNIETRPFFAPIHRQRPFRALKQRDLPVISPTLARQGLYLPSGAAYSEDSISRVCDAVVEISQLTH